MNVGVQVSFFAAGKKIFAGKRMPVSKEAFYFFSS